MVKANRKSSVNRSIFRLTAWMSSRLHPIKPSQIPAQHHRMPSGQEDHAPELRFDFLFSHTYITSEPPDLFPRRPKPIWYHRASP